jgi:hypothetical protein
MRELIRKILNESKVKDQLKQSIEDDGLTETADIVGGFDNLINLLYDGDVMEFYKDNKIKPVKFGSDGMSMYIDDIIIEQLDLPISSYSRRTEKKLGDFKWITGGGDYNISVAVYPVKVSHYGYQQPLWKVVGRSGDYGFGYSFITKKHELGKTARKKIFQQIIDKYNLQQYL